MITMSGTLFVTTGWSFVVAAGIYADSLLRELKYTERTGLYDHRLLCTILFVAQVVMQFDFGMTTPKALANFSPGLELATTLGHQLEMRAKR